MKTIELSIVVPVYNVMKYLPQCIDTLLHQDLVEYEIILVDDGSTDGSQIICDKYAEDVPNIKVIHQSNQGLAGARNQGIKEAKGKYILFVDSDDFIHEHILKKLLEYTQLQCSDVCFLNAYKYYENGKMVNLDQILDANKIENKEKIEVLEYLASLKKFPGSACTKMVKRQLIEEHEIYFENGHFSEDLLWTIKLFCSADKFCCFNMPYYYYRQNRTGSITNQISTIKYEDVFYFITEAIRYMKDKQVTDEVRASINSFMAYELEIQIMNFAKVPVKDKNQYINQIYELFYLLESRKDRKTKLIKRMVQMIGIRATSYILCSIYIMREIYYRRRL